MKAGHAKSRVGPECLVFSSPEAFPSQGQGTLSVNPPYKKNST